MHRDRGIVAAKRARSVLAVAVVALSAASAQSQDTAILERLRDERASVREAATRALSTEASPEILRDLLARASTMPAETMRRVAVALGRNGRLLGALARRLESADAGAGLAARALHEHYLAHSVPAPDDADAVALLPTEAIEMRGLKNLEDFVDAMIIDGGLPVPIILDPTLALDGSPARSSWSGRRGAMPLRHVLPSITSKRQQALRMTVLPRALLVADEGGVRSVPALFVRSLAFLVSPRAPVALRRRAAVALGCLDLPTTEKWLRAEARGEGEVGEAAALALAVRVLRGTSSHLWGSGEDAERLALRSFRLASVPGQTRPLYAAALRVALARAFDRGVMPAWVARAAESPWTDPTFTALAAKLPPGAFLNALEDRVTKTDAAAGGESFANLVLCLGRVRSSLPPTLQAKLRSVVDDPATPPRLLMACLRVLDRRAPEWQAGVSELPGTTEAWNGDAARGRVWGASLRRRQLPVLGLVALSKVETLSVGGYAMLHSAFDARLSWAAWTTVAPKPASASAGAKLSFKSRAVHDLLLGEVLSEDRGDLATWGAAFDRLRGRLDSVASESEARALGRAYGRCLLAFSQPHRGRAASSWLVDLLTKRSRLAVFSACYRRVLAARPLLARDVLFELPRRQDLARDVRVEIPSILEALTRERPRGKPVIDPEDPIRR